MTVGLIGYKCGMTRFFTNEGLSIPVTVIKFYSNYISVIKVKDTDGYYALKVAACNIKKDKLVKPLLGFYKKYGIDYCKYIVEFRIKENDVEKFSQGKKLDISLFNDKIYVDVSGVSKGKGFAGVVRRYNFSMQRASHGNSLSHRVPGSIGQCQTPGKVFKGKKMPGHMGNDNVTIKNVKICKIYYDYNVILLKGSIPGAIGGKIIVKIV